jgi:acyl-coenzyme A synthetase/AMP-(fatty) acid ligase
LSQSDSLDRDLSKWLLGILRVDPVAPAILFEGRWFTWAEISTLVDSIDEQLSERGIGLGEPVGVVLRNRPGSVAAVLALLGTRRTLVALNSAQPDSVLENELSSIGLSAVIAHSSDWGRLGLERGASGSVRIQVAENPVAVKVLSEPAPRRPRSRMPTPEIAVDIPTSGTTGPPKRIQLPYRSLEASLIGAEHYQAGARPPEPQLRSGVAIVWVPLVHISGLWHLIAAVAEGRRVILMERFQVDPWVALVAEHKPRLVGLPPAAMRMILDANVPVDALRSLRAVRAGTAPLDPALAEEWERTYEIPVLVTYGATEFAGAVAGLTLADHERYGKGKRGSVGRAHPGIELRIVDDQGRQLGTNAIGLVEARGDQVAAEDWVRTTDLGRIDEDGFLWIVGRSDDVINRGGFKVSTTVLANTLASHPDVRDSCVVGIPDARLGEVPVAAVESLPSHPVSAEQLLGWLRERVPAYQVPVEIRVVPALPRTPSLKISRGEVRRLFTESE